MDDLRVVRPTIQLASAPAASRFCGAELSRIGVCDSDIDCQTNLALVGRRQGIKAGLPGECGRGDTCIEHGEGVEGIKIPLRPISD